MNDNDEALITIRPPRRDSLHAFILESFAETGRSPSLDEIRARFALSTLDEAESRVRQLEETGAIHRSAGDPFVTHAYPFSNEPTPHRVHLDGGPQVFAMCAIDALGMPFMLRRDAEIESLCAECAVPVRIVIHAGEITTHMPAEPMVWLADRTEGCITATDLCPDLNFFCSSDHLDRWRRRAGASGQQLTLADALAHGRRVFEGLMDEPGR